MEHRPVKPLYTQIADDLISRIKSGDLTVGDKIPSENELAHEYTTSRVTVRKSLARLKEMGFLATFAGKGNYIVQPDRSEFRVMLGYQENGKESSALDAGICIPPAHVCTALGIGPREKTLRLTMLFERNKTVSGCVFSYIKYVKGTPLLEKQLNFSDPVSKRLHESIRISAACAGPAAPILGLAPDAPVLLLRSTLTDLFDGSIKIFRELYMLPEQFHLQGD